MGFAAVIAIAGMIAGAIAAVAGFGIGSILTPIVALRTDTKIAVAALSIPHLLGTAVRFWRLRQFVDRALFLSFGIASCGGRPDRSAPAWLRHRPHPYLGVRRATAVC